MMIRTDNLGVTSVIRALGLRDNYDAMIDYFRSDAWKLSALEYHWWQFVSENAPLMRYNDAVILVGDGSKVNKEGRRMPGVKRLHQESEDSSKAETIWGQMYGCVGALADAGGKTFCIPLACELHEGVKEIISWDEVYGYRQGSHTVELISLAHHTAKVFQKTILLLDRYYLTEPALERLHALNAGGKVMDAIIMAKSNVIAYEIPDERKANTRGRPSKKGKSIKLSTLFGTEAADFTQCEVGMYGKNATIRYLVKDLLWGRTINRMLRFVLVEYGGRHAIIASTDTGLEPEAIIELYAKRFSIECTFKTMKHDVAAFSNRFWSKSMPKLDRYAKSSDDDRAKAVKSEHDRKYVRKSLDATEGYVFCGVVATGLLQTLSLLHINNVAKMHLRYQRTPPRTAASESMVSEFLSKNLFRLFAKSGDLTICKIIHEKMEVNDSFMIDFDTG